MLDLSVSDLTKSFGATPILRGVNLCASAGTLTAILGPSGCGKTTLLRLVAGFDAPDGGRIRLGEQVLFENGRAVPPEHRQIGYVVQEGALFPHLTVSENIRFGLRTPKDTAKRRAVELLEMVGLDSELAERYPHQLSGGQQQRVALARALAPEPKVILLDEPFASLDAGLRDSTRRAVAQLLAQTGATVILVTHDQSEALSLADQVAVMRQGQLLQVATPADLYRHPVNAEVAASMGEVVLLPAVIHNGEAVCALGRLPVQAGAASGAAEILLRPEQLVLETAGTEQGTPAAVVDVTFYGHDALVRLALTDGTTVQARPAGYIAPRVGDRVSVVVHGAAHAFGQDPASSNLDGRSLAV
jgi:iron(III) transport system ATP-binding protein